MSHIEPDKKSPLSRREFFQGLSLVLPLAAFGGAAAPFLVSEAYRTFTGTREFIDDAQRAVVLPDASAIKHVFFDGIAAQSLLFAVDPQRAIATAGEFTPDQMEYFPLVTRDLPIEGAASPSDDTKKWIYGTDTQLILSVGCDDDIDTHKAAADKLQDFLDIPVVYLNGMPEHLGSAIRKLGYLLDMNGRAEQIANYVDTIYSTVINGVAKVPEQERRKVLFLSDDFGTQCESFNPPFAHTFALAGALNAAENTPESNGIIQINPNVSSSLDPYALFGNTNFVEMIGRKGFLGGAPYANTAAAKEKRIYVAPTLPLPWCLDSSGIQCILGMQRIANLLYPEAYAIDINQAVKDFYNIIWQVELSDIQIDALLTSD